MKKILFFAVLLLVFIYGCNQVVCNTPYIQVGNGCCLDADSNKICDKDEVFEERSEIVITEKEPPKVIKEEVEVTKYVCSDGSVVVDSSNCPIEETEPAEKEVPELITTNEIGTVIEEVKLNTGCIVGQNGGEVFFKVGTIPSKGMAVEVKEIGKEYSHIFSKNGLYDGFISFVICSKCRGGDFKLEPDKKYILRLMFDQTAVYDRIEYSNEHLIDTTPSSEYMTKRCN